MEDQLELVVTVDLRVKFTTEELKEGFGTVETPDIIARTVASLSPTGETTQTGAVQKWIQDNEPEFEVMGIQGIWA